MYIVENRGLMSVVLTLNILFYKWKLKRNREGILREGLFVCNTISSKRI